MTERTAHTAILVFVRSEGAEAAQKTFYRPLGWRGNRRVARLFNCRIRQLAQSTGLPTYVVSSRQQRGSTFGERFTQAIASVFARGFARVIAVGNDCPALDRRRLLEAADLLEDHPAVIGPTLDGGAYLIGLHRSAFRARSFQDLPWRQADLLDQLQLHFSTPRLLALERDIDDSRDFNRLARQAQTVKPLRWLVKLLSAPPVRILPSVERPHQVARFHFPSWRGPPAHA